jgi:hypothetical protein
MSKNSASEPLGLVLQKADLVSAEQVNVALSAQKQADRRRLGEILAAKGVIKQQTADFFSQTWPNLFDLPRTEPIGQYLKAAALLDEEQIETILEEQKLTGGKFGTIAVLKGWLRQNTIDFFVEHLEVLRQWQAEKNSLLDRGISLSQSKQLLNLHERLISDRQCDPVMLLKLYKQVWQQGSIVPNGSQEELELIKIGLLSERNNRITIADPMYQSVFDANWVDGELARLQPYSKIRLKLFNLEEKASLPYKVLTEISYWTGNQAFLTQKICQLLSQEKVFIEVGQEAVYIKNLVRTRIVDRWQNQIAADHLLHVRDYILENHNHHPVTLLKFYRQIWEIGDIPAQNSSLEAELLNIGLIVKEESKLRVANRIYQSVFDRDWVDREVSKFTNSQSKAGDRNLLNNNREKISSSARRISNLQEHRKTPLWIWISITVLILIPGLWAIASEFFQKDSEVKTIRQDSYLLKQGR